MSRLKKVANRVKLAKWLQLDVQKPLAVPGYGEGDSTVETYYEKGILSLDTLDYAIGYNNEKRQWREENGERYFGNYSEEQWNKFLEDIKQNGIKEPIKVEVYPNGTIAIWEGNHRVEAARQLNLEGIPAEVYYMGGAENKFRITAPLNLDDF